MNSDSFKIHVKKEFLTVRFFDGEQCVVQVNLSKKIALDLGLELRDQAQK